MCLPPEKGDGGTILGKLRLRALAPPRDPSLSPAWAWVRPTGHPCSCRQTRSVTNGPRPWPGSPCAAPVPHPHWCWVPQGRAPAAHSWQRAGAWEPEEAASPQIPRRGSSIRASPVFSAPSCHLPLSLLGKEAGRPAFLHTPLPTAAFPNLPSSPAGPGTLTPPPGSVWGAPPGSARRAGGAAPLRPLVPWGPSALPPASPGSSVSRTPPVCPARVGTSPPPTPGSGRPLS